MVMTQFQMLNFKAFVFIRYTNIIRLLYSSGTPMSPGHYDLLVNQHIISNTHTVINATTDPQGFSYC